jgi:hypothetical protein
MVSYSSLSKYLMARTRHTTRKSTGRLPVGQLAPRNVLQPQESQPNIPQEASPEEELFEIELVIPESPTAQDSSAEEQQQPKDHDTEDKTNKEHPPPSNTESEKMYRDADEVESFGVESPILAGRLRALPLHLCNFLWTQGSFCNKQVLILLSIESGYHIVTIRVNETSWAHVWRLCSHYLGMGYDTIPELSW